MISEDWRTDRFKQFVEDWAYAARAERSMQDMRIAQFGQMPGMGDIATDEASFMRTLGPQVDRLSMGLIEERMHEVADEAVAAAVAADEERFEIDDTLSDDAYEYASRFEVAIQDLLDEEWQEWSPNGSSCLASPVTLHPPAILSCYAFSSPSRARTLPI